MLPTTAAPTPHCPHCPQKSPVVATPAADPLVSTPAADPVVSLPVALLQQAKRPGDLPGPLEEY